MGEFNSGEMKTFAKFKRKIASFHCGRKKEGSKGQKVGGGRKAINYSMVSCTERHLIRDGIFKKGPWVQQEMTELSAIQGSCQVQAGTSKKLSPWPVPSLVIYSLLDLLVPL